MKQKSQYSISLFVLFVLMPFHTTCCFSWCKEKQNKITPIIISQQTPTFYKIKQQLPTLEEQIKIWTENTFEDKKNNIDFTQITNNIATVLNQFNLVKNEVNSNNPLSIETTVKINLLRQRFTFAQRLRTKSSSLENINKIHPSTE